MAEQQTGSALAVDFGSVHTRALLFDVVDGVYRLVSRAETRSTDGFPWNDLSIGLERVLNEIKASTGRELLNANGEIITPEADGFTGVETVSVTASIGRPLRAVLIGLSPEVSIISALRATAGTYIEVAGIITLDDDRTEEERLNTIMLTIPDVIFIVGGTEDGAQDAVMQLAKVARLAVSLISKVRRPSVIYAGNSQNADAIQELFGNLVTVLIAENLRPTVDEEELDSARLQLAKAFDQYKETHSESFAKISEMSHTGVLPTAQSYNTVVEYLGQTVADKVIAVDMGSSSSIVAASVDGHHNISIRTDLGIGHSAELLLDTVGVEAVKNWLPFYTTTNELKTYVANKALRPATVPIDLRELHIEHALMKAALQHAIADARPTWQTHGGIIPFNVLLGAGNTITNLGNYGYSTLLLLDAVQPGGVTQIKADSYGVISALGAVALQNPQAVVQLLAGNALEHLGTAICPTGKPRQDRNAVNVSITFEDGEVLKETVKGGHLWSYPLGANETVEVKLKCTGNLSINGRRSLKTTITGGKLGLIIDARGRPISLGMTPEARAQQIPMWISELTGDEMIPIDERWLEHVEDKQELTDDDVFEALADGDGSGKKRRRRRGRRRRGRGKEAVAEDNAIRDDDLDALFGDDADDDDLDAEFGDEFEDDLGDLRSGILS